MRNCAAVLIASVLWPSAILAQTAAVPFVGCASEGQIGPQEAPKGTEKEVEANASVARRLAYYQAFGSGVLAPRGWYCFGVYGSGGSSLFVVPERINKDSFSPNGRGFTGAVVVVDNVDGDTSGRFAVADVIARVFPAHRGFVENVIDLFDEPAGTYTFAPYPADKLIIQTARLVQFQTPPHSEGLGTMNRIKPNDDPIDGVAILEGKTPDLLMLRVRLPRELRGLAPIITRQMESER